MRSLLAIAVLALLPLAASAQRRGVPAARMAPMRAPAGRSFVARPAPVRSGFAFRPGRVLTANPRWRRRSFGPGHFRFNVGRFPFGVHPQNRCFSDAFFDPFFCTRQPTRFASFAPFASIVPFASYPLYSMPFYDESSYRPRDDSEQLERTRAQASDLANQLQQLREELREMREERSAPQAAAAPAPQPAEAAKQPAVPTTLVFRDGRRSEVENYAIVGSTVWVFNDQRRKKIPIGELDLQATQLVNEEHGVEFAIPPSAK
jgi:hypothetical protein